MPQQVNSSVFADAGDMQGGVYDEVPSIYDYAHAFGPRSSTEAVYSKGTMGNNKPKKGQGECQLLHPATPYYPFPRGNFHTRGNIWGVYCGLT